MGNSKEYSLHSSITNRRWCSRVSSKPVAIAGCPLVSFPCSPRITQFRLIALLFLTLLVLQLQSTQISVKHLPTSENPHFSANLNLIILSYYNPSVQSLHHNKSHPHLNSLCFSRSPSLSHPIQLIVNSKQNPHNQYYFKQRITLTPTWDSFPFPQQSPLERVLFFV